MIKTKYKIKKVQPQSEEQQQQVYFRLRRPIDQEQPEPELIVNSVPYKRQTHKPQPNQQEPAISVSIPNSKTQQSQMPNPSTAKEQKQQKVSDILNLLRGMDISNPVQYFLKRVKAVDLKPLELQKWNKVQTLVNNQRSQRRQDIFEKKRGLQSKNHVKIVDLEKQYVQLGSQKVEVEDLSEEKSEVKQYYYKLSKRKIVKEGPTVSLPENEAYLLDRVEFEEMEEEDNNSQKYGDDDQDSNRESNPDYDYPDEGYSQQSDSDEGVIDKDYYPGKEDDEDEYRGDDDGVHIDEEEIYRRYLNRCKDQRNRTPDSDDQYF